METGAITSYFDVAQIVLYAFWIFFIGLVLYLRREDKREGYPLVSDHYAGRGRIVGFPDLATPKQFDMPHGGGKRFAPRAEIDDAEIAAEPTGPWPGAPLHPTGNPMKDGVGPAAYAKRPDVPDITHLGEAKIVPMRVAKDFSIEAKDPDPRGVKVVGADGVLAGEVTDVWVDRSEPQIRYLELQVNGKQVMLPINFVSSCKRGQNIKVNSILGTQFADVPSLSNPEQITLQEEDKVCAYYGGGQLYATPSRVEPLI